MPLTPPCDDAGHEIDPEVYARLLDKESRDALRVERYTDPENPKLIAFRVLDASGVVRGRIAFEYAAMEKDLPARMLQRVQRAADITPRPDLKLVG